MRHPLMFLFPIAMVLLVPSESEAFESYRRVITKKAVRDFYRCGGMSHRGRAVHIHIDASVLRRPFEKDKVGARGFAMRFQNRTVPILIRNKHRDYRRLKHRLKESKTLCVKAKVIKDPRQPARCALWVDKIRRMPKKMKSP